jgi:Staphylococcal nuclease homologue
MKVLVAGRQLIKVCVNWIDAPEMHQAFGYRAKQAMSELVFGKDVELRPQAIDRYGRLVAEGFVNGNDAGVEMMRLGLAWVFESYIKEASAGIQASYRQAQEEARAKRSALWADPEPMPPWENYALARENCRHEKSSTAPKKGINTQPAFASGTTGIGRTGTVGGLAVAVVCAYARTGSNKVAATKAQTLEMRLGIGSLTCFCYQQWLSETKGSTWNQFAGFCKLSGPLWWRHVVSRRSA